MTITTQQFWKSFFSWRNKQKEKSNSSLSEAAKQFYKEQCIPGNDIHNLNLYTIEFMLLQLHDYLLKEKHSSKCNYAQICILALSEKAERIEYLVHNIEGTS